MRISQKRLLPVGSRLPRQCVCDLVESWARQTPDAVAILAPGRTPLTYGRLHHHVESTVRILNGMGVGRNDRVATVLPNGPETAVAFIAVAAGATAAPLNPVYTANEFEFYLSDLRAKALIVQSGMRSPAEDVARSLGIRIVELSPCPEAAGLFTLAGELRPSAAQAGFARPEDVALVLHTSGTTARPKIVPLTQRNICTSASNIQIALELVDGDRCLNVMPLFHVHGLIGAVLSSLAAGASVICAPGYHAPQFFEWLEGLGPTWYTAVPTIHQAVLVDVAARSKGAHGTVALCDRRNPAEASTYTAGLREVEASDGDTPTEHTGIGGRHSLRFIRSCSSPLPPKVMAELESAFQVPVIESYGMTEASHQVTSNPLPPGIRKAGSVGVATGTEVAVVDEAGRLQRAGERGEIVIRGPNVMAGYENNPAANEGAFTNGWFRTGDQGYLDADGYLYLTGRLKEIINRGGEKISPREVDEVLLDHPAVAQAVTFAVAHPKLGEDVAAAVVLRENAAATGDGIREFAAARLAGFKVPRQVVVVPEIPRGPTGKPQRIGLAERLGLITSYQRPLWGRTGFTAPDTPLEEALAGLWTEVLGIKQVGIHDNFFDLGGDSLLAMQLLARVERAFGRKLPPAVLLEGGTVEHMARVLGQAEAPAPCPSLVAIQPGGSYPPFFCVHGITGLVLGYHSLARYLGPEQPFYGLQARDVSGVLDPFTEIGAMAADYIEQLRTVQPEGPYFLGGFSSGGTLVFEMAQQLHTKGHEVALLAIFDHALSCTRYRKLTKLWRPGFAFRFFMNVPGLLADFRRQTHAERARSIRRVVKDIQKRTTAELGLLRGRAGHGGARVELGDWFDELAALLPERRRFMEAYYRGVRRYVPVVYPGRITLFRAQLQPLLCSHDPQMGWGRLAAVGVEIRVIPGSHATMLLEPYVRVVAEELRVCLDKARVAGSARRWI